MELLLNSFFGEVFYCDNAIEKIEKRLLLENKNEKKCDLNQYILKGELEIYYNY
jgi:hypothetical protein